MNRRFISVFAVTALTALACAKGAGTDTKSADKPSTPTVTAGVATADPNAGGNGATDAATAGATTDVAGTTAAAMGGGTTEAGATDAATTGGTMAAAAGGTTDATTGGTTDATTGAPVHATHQVQVSGTVALSSDVLGGDLDGLVVDAPIEGAVAFLKGFPDQGFLTNAQGAFTLAIEIDDGIALVDPADYTLLVWKVTPGGKKFGIRMPVRVAPDVVYDLDQVNGGPTHLTYTRQLGFAIHDDSGNLPESANCVVELPGYEGKVVTQFNAARRFTVDYLPAGDYHYVIKCPLYLPLSGDVTVSAPGTGFNWTAVTGDAVKVTLAPP